MEKGLEINMYQFETKEIEKAWPKIKGLVSVPHTKTQYNKMLKYLDDLIDEVGNDHTHPLAALMETIGTLIEIYEDINIPKPESDPISILKMLMLEHGLKQKDMKEIGSQGVVSDIMNNKRTLNKRQIQGLTKRFNVSPAVFI